MKGKGDNRDRIQGWLIIDEEERKLKTTLVRALFRISQVQNIRILPQLGLFTRPSTNQREQERTKRQFSLL